VTDYFEKFPLPPGKESPIYGMHDFPSLCKLSAIVFTRIIRIRKTGKRIRALEETCISSNPAANHDPKNIKNGMTLLVRRALEGGQ
jgi:hypothetical protein